MLYSKIPLIRTPFVRTYPPSDLSPGGVKTKMYHKSAKATNQISRGVWWPGGDRKWAAAPLPPPASPAGKRVPPDAMFADFI